MVHILFVCLGNICRSPMAEFVMQHLVNEQGLTEQFQIASAATSTEELGNGVHHGTREKMAEVGIACRGDKRARQMTRKDYDAYDYLIGMDSWNMRNMMRIFGSDPEHKVYKLLEFAGRPDDVADPWYTGNFDATYDDVLKGCTALLNEILDTEKFTKEN